MPLCVMTARGRAKTCVSCGELKLATEYYLRKRAAPEGKLHSMCKVCHRAERKRWRDAHPNYNKEYRRTHKEQIRAQRRWYVKRSYRNGGLPLVQRTPELIEWEIEPNSTPDVPRQRPRILRP